MSTDVFDDLAAEQDRIEAVLAALSAEDWLIASSAAGWTIADVLLHLAQSEKTVALTMSGGLVPGSCQRLGASVDEAMAEWVRRDTTRPEQVFDRWRSARRAALTADSSVASRVMTMPVEGDPGTPGMHRVRLVRPTGDVADARN